jgi:uncharacterized membrane protein YeaQ/YmgE (transglycosylase-associated protein family)
MNLIAWLVLGAIAGYLAGFIVKGDETLGVVGKIALGIAGAVVGGFTSVLLFGVDPIHNPIQLDSIVAATVGSVVIMVLGGLVSGRRRTGQGLI